MNKILSFLFIFVFFISLHSSSFWFEEDTYYWSLTLREMSFNIENIKNKKSVFLSENKQKEQEYWNIVEFIKKDLTKQDFENIKNIINLFVEKRNNLDEIFNSTIEKKEDTSKIRREILQNELDFYTEIWKFIDKSKRNDYLEYVKFKLETRRDKDLLLEELLISQNALDSRIYDLNLKIDNHRKNLEENLSQVIRENIKNKIDKIILNPKYENISSDQKRIIITWFISDLKEKLEYLNDTNLSKNYILIKENILKSIIEELEKVVKNL